MSARPFLLRVLLWGTALLCGVSFAIGAGAWKFVGARTSIMVLGAATFISLAGAIAPPRARAILGLIVGVGGMAVWLLFDPPIVLGVLGDGIFALFAALALIPAGIVDRLRRPSSDVGAMAVTAGVVAVLGVWFIPWVEAGSIMFQVTQSLKDTSRFTWTETAMRLWFLLPPLAAAVALLCWRPGRSRRTLIGVAVVFVLWIPGLQILSDVAFLLTAYGWDAVARQPFALLLPAQLICYGALVAIAPTEVERAIRS